MSTDCLLTIFSYPNWGPTGLSQSNWHCSASLPFLQQWDPTLCVLTWIGSWNHQNLRGIGQNCIHHAWNMAGTQIVHNTMERHNFCIPKVQLSENQFHHCHKSPSRKTLAPLWVWILASVTPEFFGLPCLTTSCEKTGLLTNKQMSSRHDSSQGALWLSSSRWESVWLLDPQIQFIHSLRDY